MKSPKPFFRNQTKSFYVQLSGKMIPLGKDKKAAWDKYYELMAARNCAPKQVGTDPTVADLLLSYLDWCEANRSKSTYEKDQLHIESFAKAIGPDLKLSCLKIYHVQRWLDAPRVGRPRKNNEDQTPRELQSYSKCSATYQNTAITSVKRALNWAVEQQYVQQNPIAQMKKPTAAVRELFLSATEWNKLFDAATDDTFLDYLKVMLYTGARPQEIRIVEARHFNAEQSAWIFPRVESKGKRKQRVVYLPPTPLATTVRLCEQYPEGPLFRNRDGKPWTKDAIKCRFTRLANKLSIPGLCAYTLRHSYAHYMMTEGKQDSLTVSKLMGHSDGRMLSTLYGHLEQNPTFLLQKAAQSELATVVEPAAQSDAVPRTDPGRAA
jgi:integrase